MVRKIFEKKARKGGEHEERRTNTEAKTRGVRKSGRMERNKQKVGEKVSSLSSSYYAL